MKYVIQEIIGYALLLLVVALIVLLFLIPSSSHSSECYRPPVYYAPPIYYPPPPVYQPPYYYKEYVPYVLEVQVYRDRYYALSDLYRDRMYIEAFDMLRDMRAKMEYTADRKEQDPPTKASPVQQLPPVAPKSVGSYSKTTPKALEILSTNCFTCHAKGNDKLDLSEPDLVSPTKRWAAFGMAAARDMPKPPDSKLEKGKEKELEDWKSEHALKDEQLKTLYEEWVLATKSKKK